MVAAPTFTDPKLKLVALWESVGTANGAILISDDILPVMTFAGVAAHTHVVRFARIRPHQNIRNEALVHIWEAEFDRYKQALSCDDPRSRILEGAKLKALRPEKRKKNLFNISFS